MSTTATLSWAPGARPRPRLYARHRLDAGPSDLAAASAALLAKGAPPPPAAGTLRCLSVRSGFHLLLEALQLAPGTEVAFSALTHPDLPALARFHGLVPVPIDLDPHTLAPEAASLRSALGDRTGMVVIAHLFGGLVDLQEVHDAMRGSGALLVEDCAQAYAGPGFDGDARAAVSMFSFGVLKTATAFGGAVLHVRDRRLLGAMSELQAGWPVQEPGAYAARVASAALLMGAGRPLPFGLIAALHHVRGRDFDQTVNGAVRAFRAPSVGDLVERLAVQPGAPLLRVIEHRERCFDPLRLLRRAEAGELALAALPRGLEHPGDRMLRRTHWLFPVVSGDPARLVARARAQGFDAARAASNLAAVAAPEGRPQLEPIRARDLLRGLVYLPLYPEIPERHRTALLRCLEPAVVRRPPGVVAA